MNFFHIPPFLLLVLLLINSRASILGHSNEMDIGASRIRCSESERRALLKFKEELVDTNGRLSSWGNEEDKRDCCKWIGVHCHNRTNHVTQLDLNSEAADAPLKGVVSTSLLELQDLQYLDLSSNDFGQVRIPEFIGSLTKLHYLNLSAAGFLGPIPHHLGNLSRLMYLDLSDNDFDEVRIPEFIGSLTKLRYVDLSFSRFRGPIPHNLGNLSNLLHLDLKYNWDCYSESLDWVSHLHSLKHLDLGGTNLSKATNWLQAISKLTSIQELQLWSSSLPEILPTSLPSINASTPLTTLDLSWNSFNVSTLALISWFSNFSNTGLTSIYFRGNRMPSPIPDIFAGMISLANLDLSFTGLEGGIPNYFGNMSSLISLSLGHNNLIGELSEIMKNLSGPVEEKLQSLYLNNNSLSGSFSNMSRFSSLRSLYLSSNQLSGSIPEGYLKLPHLLDLDLSLNKFTGPLLDLSFSSSLEYLYLYNNKFGGTLTESVGRLSNLRTLMIRSNLFQGTITEASVTNLSRLDALDLSSNPSLIVKFDHYRGIPFQLDYLRLRHCKAGPHFPLWLKSQRQLNYIDISSTGISDNIPSWFFGSVASTYLNASNNQITGVIPKSSFSSMSLSFPRSLDLSRNNISGSINFLCHTREWDLIDLSDNHFFGHIPDCFSHFERLRYLNLANNSLSGKIPHSFGSLSDLLLLHLRNNKFSGELPISMANCTNLKMIDVGQNRLTGKVPAWIGDCLSKLKVLILRSNEFYGNLPLSLCGLADIQILDISSNKISGAIPNCVHKYMAMTQVKNESVLVKVYVPIYYFQFEIVHRELPNQLQSAYFMWKGQEVKYGNNLGLVQIIDLSSNNLVGQIPSGITKLVGLVGLNVSRNKLNGSIPHNIGELKSLDFLDFSRNHLSGSIPLGLGKLTLGVLNLSYNNLSGRIPKTTQMQTYELAYIGNPDLCGLPLNKSCQGDGSHQDSDSSNNAMNKEEFEEDKFVTGGFFIALGLGFVVGFWGTFGTILLNDGMRCAFFKVLNIVQDFVYVRVVTTKARLLRRIRNG